MCRTLTRIESECKMAWDYLRIVAKHDDSNGNSGSANPNAESIEQVRYQIQGWAK